MSNDFIRDLTVAPEARRARQIQAGEEVAEARLITPKGSCGGWISTSGKVPTILTGGGFTVANFNAEVGRYTITFNPTFVGNPTVTFGTIGVNVVPRLELLVGGGKGVAQMVVGLTNAAQSAFVEGQFMFKAEEF